MMTFPPDPRSALLRHKADSRCIALLIACSGVYLAHWLQGGNAHGLLIPSVLLAVTACAVKHNHIHSPTFRSARLNRAFNLWLAVLTGTSTTGIRIAHNQRHHRGNQSADDFVRCSQVRRKSAPAAFVGFLPLVIVKTWVHAAEDAASLRGRSSALLGLLRRERTAIWIIVAAGVWHDWRQWLCVFPGPWLFGQWFLVTINLLQHDGLEAGDDLHASRNVARRLSNWLFLNNGYHTAHHLRPALHWSFLPDYHRRELAARLPRSLVHSLLTGLFCNWLKARSSMGGSR